MSNHEGCARECAVAQEPNKYLLVSLEEEPLPRLLLGRWSVRIAPLMQGCVPTGCSLSAECLQPHVQALAEPLDRADQRWAQQQVCGEQTGEPWRAIDVVVVAVAAADECPVTLLHSA